MLTPSRFNILVRVVLVGLLCNIAKPAPAATPKGRMWDANADQLSAVRWVVSDFEKCLRRSDPSRCQRQLSDDAILVFDGTTQASVNNLAIQENHNPAFSQARVKLAYRQLLINGNAAQVIVDEPIAGETHTYTVRVSQSRLRYKWQITRFESAPIRESLQASGCPAAKTP